MVSSLKNMIWGKQAASGGGDGESDGEETKGQARAGLVTAANTVKEGWLYKQSRYMKQWKR